MSRQNLIDAIQGSGQDLNKYGNEVRELLAEYTALRVAALWVRPYLSDMKRRGLAEVPDLATDALVAALDEKP